MNLKAILFSAAALCAMTACAQKNTVDIYDTAVKVADQGLARIDHGHYPASVLYNGMAELALFSGKEADMKKVVDVIQPMADGKYEGWQFRNFLDYEVGGVATSLLAWKGQESLVAGATKQAAYMWTEQPRTSDNVMTGYTAKWWLPHDGYWIDLAMTVTPFYLYAGLLEKNQEYIDYAAYLALTICDRLHDASNDLYHQAYNYPGGWPDMPISEDNWSRGNGWMSMALSALLRDYPRDGQYWERIAAEGKRFYTAVCRIQDENGMWHQEMSNPESYVETSGSALLLAGVGAAIEAGILDKKEYKPYFEKGLRGILSYIDPDGCVGHTCMGNLAPNKGLKKDFEIRHWYYNENHSFGPQVLALAQALRLGYKKISLPAPMGWANDPDRPRAYVKIATERKDDVAWENDRIAFRVYSQVVDNKAANGVDVWPKTVDYSIIDKWYENNNNKISYHVDHGEGCDWYVIGNRRGTGGTGIWDGEKLVWGEVYDKCEIANAGPKHIDFTLSYKPFEVNGDSITETKRIEMVNETSFYRVTETVTSASGNDVILAVGVQSMTEDGTVEASAEEGKLYTFDVVTYKNPLGIGVMAKQPNYEAQFGSGILADPATVAGIAKDGPDQLMLLKVKSGQPVTYYVGASYGFQQNSGKLAGNHKQWKADYDNNSFAAQEAHYASR